MKKTRREQCRKWGGWSSAAPLGDSISVDSKGWDKLAAMPVRNRNAKLHGIGRLAAVLYGAIMLVSDGRVVNAAVQLDTALHDYNVFDKAAADSNATTTLGVLPDEKQFESAITSGAVLFSEIPDPKSGATDAVNDKSLVDVPSNAASSIVMPFARVAAPYIQRPTLFLIGSVIEVPDVNESNLSLTDDPNDYWFDEPFVPEGTEHPTDYYWSPHATHVFAVRSGVVEITWRKRESLDQQPAGTEDVDWTEIGGAYFTLFTKSYLISSSAAKSVQKLYWNTAPYSGPIVDLPGSRVGEVYFAYTDSFPEEVQYDGDTDFDGTIDGNLDGDMDGVVEDEVDPRIDRTNNTFTRTVWRENLGQTSQIRAQNIEGRLFMEILGDVVSTDGAVTVREHLGFEILEVNKYPTAGNLTAELGELITPGVEDSPLVPVAVDPLSSRAFFYEHSVEGVGFGAFYAVRETENANDLLIHWLLEGVEGILWPAEFYRYELKWPDDISEYSQYVRTAVASEEEAKESAVILSPEDVPFIAYQDITDEPRAKLTEDSRFYTHLDSTVPSHRTLLRFNSDDNVSFERVYSWLDGNLVSDGISGVVSEFELPTADTELPGSIAFNSQAFVLEASVMLKSRGDFDRLAQLTVRKSDGSSATVDLGVSISNEQPYPYIDVYGEILSDAETANLNGESADGGLRYRADLMPVKAGHDDLTDWRAMIVGATDPSVGVNGSSAHYGVLFRGNGKIEVWDGNYEITETIFYADDGDHGGVFHRINLLAAGDDGNPFDGEGSTIVDVYSTISPAAIHSFEKEDPGYLDNFFRSYSGGDSDGELKNLRVTRINDGTAFASSTTEFPLNESVLVKFVGDQDEVSIFLDGVLAAEGPNFVGVQGVVEKIEFGSDLGADLEFETLKVSPSDLTVNRPRVVHQRVEVGLRIMAPDGETGASSEEDYLAGYINQAVGDLYSVSAYVNPLDRDNSFEDSNLGAIIPVNSIPGDNTLEVWWMRPNEANSTLGFHTVYWPAVLGIYTIEWPDDAPEIVLASNDGSGALDSEPATGEIYFQNDLGLPGYNPNEEHALMSGGQAFALRDDLNITETQNTSLDVPYSSEPYVLLEYSASDSRPAMIAFKVVRENADSGDTFDYEVDAGSILQPPMPLPLLTSTSASLRSELILSSEVDSQGASSLAMSSEPKFVAFEHVLLESLDGTDPLGFYITSVDYENSVVTGYVTEGEVYDIEHQQYASWRRNQHAENSNGRVEVFRGSEIPDFLVAVDDKVLLISPGEARSEVFDLVDTKDNRLYVSLPTATTANFDEGGFEAATQFVFLEEDVDPDDFTDGATSWRLTSTLAIDAGSSDLYDDFTLVDRKGNRWVYRGPHDDKDGDRFMVQYSYETLDGFYFPGNEEQPGIGTLTPYLRPVDGSGGFIGSSFNGASEDGLIPFPVTYLPVWPSDAPQLHRAETLTLSRRGLPAVRGQSSLEIVYDQSWATSEMTVQGALLHDPTREKEYELGTTNTLNGVEFVLSDLPASVSTSTYNGDTFFTELPPHLSERFFLDPNRGENGALVFKGEFFDETVGEDFVHLNVAGAKDLEALNELVDTADEDYEVWTLAILSMNAVAETYLEDPDVPGTYLPGSEIQSRLDEGLYVNPDDQSKAQTRTIAEERLASVHDFYRDDASSVTGFEASITDLMEVVDDDVAVDSYALTATGLSPGYITLIAGNGYVFTDPDDPVEMYVIEVVETWHPGEVKLVLSPNPLGEKVTVQQVVDLAGKAKDTDGNALPLYAFDWRLGAPEDGLAPSVFENQVATLWNAEGWTHLPLPTISDTVDDLDSIDSSRTTSFAAGSTSLVVWNEVAFSDPVNSVEAFGLKLVNRAANFAEGGLLRFTDSNGSSSVYSVDADSTSADITATLSIGDDLSDIATIEEYRESDIPQAYLFSEFDALSLYSEVWFSLNIDTNKLGARIYLNGTEVVATGMTAIDSAVTDSNVGDPPDGLSPDFAPVGDAFLVSSERLTTDGSANQLVVALYTTDEAIVGDSETFELKVEGLEYIDIASSSSKWIPMDDEKFEDGIRAIIGGTADVQSLSDQHVIMRYGPANPNYVEGDSLDDSATEWSEWTDPVLVEGWIKRVLAGINPFNQRTTDLFNNAVDTDASMLTLAGPRWDGDIALNSDTINDFGLIEIYETVLNRGRGLSIDADINYGPANDALLLAAGYINDLYMFVGNEAYADALNPTIGIGTADGALGDVATASFSFQGQTATLLEEELALLRGRDDFLPPGVEANPVYNRLFWNYTRGIDSGEVIYALNYNIQEDNNSDFDGVIDAEDAAVMFPQGHGDAYGHYLTAAKGYYSLLIDPDFEWVPRTEGVTILGQTVQVDYTDERKFAAAASAVAKAGKQVLDLTWRQDFKSGDDVGWEHFGAEAVRDNSERLTSRYWGADNWASRTGQGAFVNWVAGNAMLPDVDDDPEHEGIQVIDRTTVPELAEIADLGRDIQSTMDSVDAHLNPLGLANDSVVFDVNPHDGFANGGTTHFEQILDRAKTALGNAVVAFDDAKDVTALMRSETDSLADLQTSVDRQETAYMNALIELYGSPYADDIGVGKTYETDYSGPDLLHYMYVDEGEITSPLVRPGTDEVFKVDIQGYVESFHTGTKSNKNEFDFIQKNIPYLNAEDYVNDDDNEYYVEYSLNSHGFFEKPDDWSGKRESPGKLQTEISNIIKARNKASLAFRKQEAMKYKLDRLIEVWDAQKGVGGISSEIFDLKEQTLKEQQVLSVAKYAHSLVDLFLENRKTEAQAISDAALKAVPKLLVVGFSNGTDPSAPAAATLATAQAAASGSINWVRFFRKALAGAFELGVNERINSRNFYEIGALEGSSGRMDRIYSIDMQLQELQLGVHAINEAIQNLSDATASYQKLVAQGDRIQAEREVFRRRAAALTQGYRTRDAAFRVFRDEKLERYNSLFDLASRYAFLAAKAYDYETGLLHTDQGMEFIDRIVGSRALGIVAGGEPQFAGSNTGDPGLSSTLAEMAAEWQVLRGRLGLNNPDVYNTIVSLRTENYRVLPGSDGDVNWRDVLSAGRMSNLLDDEDVVRHCMQIDLDDGLPVPGIVLEFGTEITAGNNLFGQPLAGGDHAFDVSLFATKIHSVGVVLEGYQGMDDPSSNSAVTGDASASDPTAAFLDSSLLSATPSVYLIPTGLDAMRSPPLGDESVIRTWSVEDVTIPLPFNIGGSDFSTKKLFQSSDSLTEELFSVRKHQAFRPVSDASVFGDNGRLFASTYTNNRLIGRSVWNTSWKLVIPGRNLLNDPEQGLDVLIDILEDIKIRFETYSYAGN